jgi:putative integral membrane protein (TIGR02587 family)
MSSTSALPLKRRKGRASNRAFFVGLARAFGGAVVFGIPLLMTMEMWSLGGGVAAQERLALFVLLSIPLLVGLSHYAGFEETFCLRDDLVDAFVALAVGFATSTGILWLLGVVNGEGARGELIGKIVIQALPGAIGALLATSQFGTREEEEEERQRFTRYDGELFLMGVGALFLAFNLAPTDEMILLTQQMTEAQVLMLAALSLVAMHAFVYAVQFAGSPERPEGTSRWSLFMRFTIPGYAIALLVSAFILWTFGRTDGLSLETITSTTIVLGFPAALGAAAARLVI